MMVTWPWRALPLAAVLFLFLSPAASVDTVTMEAPLAGNRTIVSAGGTFTLGFFTPDVAPAGRRYLGIWYSNILARTVVWVANRQSPVVGGSPTLKINGNGSLAIVDGQGRVVWASPVMSASVLSAGSAKAQLLDNGNFVLRFASAGVAWQSFDYPTDTLLPGMKLGIDFRTGLDRYMNSWRAADDPSPGEYSFRIDPSGSPEFFLYRWSTRTYGSGPWNGYQFSGVPNLRTNTLLSYQYVSTADEAYYRYEVDDSTTILTRFVMNSSGQIQRLMWIDTTRSWSVFSSYPMDECEAYRACGAYGVCNVEQSPMCGCAEGFEPRYPKAWALRDGSGGCIRRTALNCTGGDGFAVTRNMKLPESANATVDMALGLEECRLSCLSNCACRAYASANVTSADAKGFDNGGQDLFVRLAASDLPTNSVSDNSQTAKLVEIIVPSVVALLLLLAGLVICVIKAKKNRKAIPSALNNGQDLDLPSFVIETILYATNNFSADNKLGQGGFGPVYMGRLDNGQDIAVKRLSRRSTQGLREFKNEVKLIAKLQHRNLVRLLGCCIDGSERMLIYEYMHNRSLNTFLFNEEKQSILNWSKRFNIINGIARGILYLHQDSALRIIHRDLKASNILLDRDMNPKISDFGVARIFGTDQTSAYTKKVVGTYGYMSPEYAMDGVFSMKSDVFSFGVLVLEIVSGKKNRGFYHNELDLNLLRYAWRLWKEGRSLEFLDQSIAGTSSNVTEVLRCIQIGLLCVQEQPRHRPTMSAVTMMLSSESPALLEPCEPAFCTGRSLSDDTEASRSNSARSWTVTVVEGR
ncbi:hypothetical protein OsJ_11431 [Oryza sativa Japonica Group]|uniref:Receptor-like serine/threonine-protein kinase n=1 Tax=Oryza sativa subsp. japonica TaxID=39947 RepID=B9F999_ORYSJ|nr:hypothetical protein OsJ_11431 [Oryza sativa Japonica Group]